MRTRAPSIWAIALVASTACSESGERHALGATGGTYVDGSGRLGLAVLATLRDADGHGPDTPWTGALSGPEGTIPLAVQYPAGGNGSFAVAWWADEPPFAGTYALTLSGAGAELGSSFTIADAGVGLAPAVPSVGPEAATLAWDGVPGAASYECRVSSGATVASSQLVRTESCDLGALPPGAYAASVIAYSADLVSLAESRATAPALPARLDVSEARLAFTRPGPGTPSALLDVAGGAFSDGASSLQRTLAVWVSIRDAAGTATAAHWTVEVTGPGIDAPLSFTYPANFPRLLVWSYGHPAAQGTYGLTARSAEGALGTSFRVGSPAALGPPMDVAALAGAQGSAQASWAPVSGARSYLVSARHGTSGAFVMSQWVAGTSAGFPQGTFAAGETYDVFVAATDADMVGGAVPAELAITENTFEPASFVGR